MRGRGRQFLHGLVVDSELDLAQDRPAPDNAGTDVTVRLGPRVGPRPPRPPGQSLLAHSEAGVGGYEMAKETGGPYVARFYGVADFEISEDLSVVVVRPATGASHGVAAVLTSGAVLALQLYLRHHLVLHASAVDLGGAALAFAGGSGAGKSTMAALMCAGGARLITDDVLRLDDERTGTPRARLGATELRLRHGATTLAESFPERPAMRVSADRRQVLRLADDAEDRLPLAAVVIPRPLYDRAALRVEPMPPKEALLALLSYPRLVGWRDPAVLEHQFVTASLLVESVPVLVATVPWGPPFATGLAAALHEELAPHLAVPVPPVRS